MISSTKHLIYLSQRNLECLVWISSQWVWDLGEGKGIKAIMDFLRELIVSAFPLVFRVEF